MFKFKKEKPLSCGIIFEDKNNNILIVRPTNGSFYQIPKGLMNDNDASYWGVAKRESKEETGIDVENLRICDLDVLGLFPYRKDKDLFLFRLTLHKLPDIKDLYCESTFFNKVKKVREPEVDDYQIININDYDRWLNKSLVKVFDKIYKGK